MSWETDPIDVDSSSMLKIGRVLSMQSENVVESITSEAVSSASAVQ